MTSPKLEELKRCIEGARTEEGAIACIENFEPMCGDFRQRLKETKQIYIVGHDIPISVSKPVFEMVDRMRQLKAKEKGVPEVQYEFEDLFFELFPQQLEVG